ncbi:hypothetical protein EDEG_02695 [Edhazardia aedis USNM 41457]|uniref:Uncharacterized protein n=1 Tax=Edhazardia aedis (strain USNM 41457) TaxID=1003232 RepID=J9DJY5_EDHAE|nr:hypothetical protein EDEG_02695 [Edhazardia aedis USNM 41457]|eukprot:EJW02930.1 hypothetical protein EDEG_02695 [Edhazardia aedis USNM 41457]
MNNIILQSKSYERYINLLEPPQNNNINPSNGYQELLENNIQIPQASFLYSNISQESPVCFLPLQQQLNDEITSFENANNSHQENLQEIDGESDKLNLFEDNKSEVFEKNPTNIHIISDILSYISPNFLSQIQNQSLSYKLIFESWFKRFPNEYQMILMQAEKTTKYFEKIQISDNPDSIISLNEILSSFAETLKIFIDPIKFTQNIIKVRPIWLFLALYYPEIPNLIRMITRNYLSMANLRLTKTINISTKKTTKKKEKYCLKIKIKEMKFKI